MRLTLVITLLATLLCGSPQPASACRCGTETFARTKKHSQAIFTATLAEVKKLARGRFAFMRFVVDGVFKGKLHKTTHIVPSGTSCSITRFMVEQGKRYLVYAQLRHDGKLTVRKCQRLSKTTTRQAKRDLKRLGKPSAPLPDRKAR
jgi:hypothetical protein